MANKKSSDKLATEAGQTLNDPNATEREKRFAASIVSQADGAEEPVPVDQARLSEIQNRVREKTKKIATGEIAGRARISPKKEKKAKKNDG